MKTKKLSFWYSFPMYNFNTNNNKDPSLFLLFVNQANILYPGSWLFCENNEYKCFIYSNNSHLMFYSLASKYWRQKFIFNPIDFCTSRRIN